MTWWGGGYIEMLGNGGKNGYRYQLKSFGHRYLHEHYDDLATATQPAVSDRPILGDLAKPHEQRHGVPDLKLPASPPLLSGDQSCVYCRKRGSACSRHGGRPSAAKMYKDRLKQQAPITVRNLEPVVEKITTPSTTDVPVPLKPLAVQEQSAAPAPAMESFETVFEHTLHKILYERYGDKVTAKEVVDAMRAAGDWR